MIANPIDKRNSQAEALFEFAGWWLTWRKFVSRGAEFLNSRLDGVSRTETYEDIRIRGLVRWIELDDIQTEAGQFAAGDAMVETWVKLNYQDEVIIQGVTYRVERDSIPNPMTGTYRTFCKRGGEDGSDAPRN